MKKTPNRRARNLWLATSAVLVAAAVATIPPLRQAATWQRFASPGELAAAHAGLARDCAACHAPVAGPIRARCAVCHASDRDLLQRQSTAFHANVSSCRECHPEHRGSTVRPTRMDHAALARIGMEELEEQGDAGHRRLARYLRWARTSKAGQADKAETTLNCNGCHSKTDPHRGLFGTSCDSCHGTETWQVPRYRHPSPRSRDCAHCHQAPPSHYKMHFKMVSARVARKPKAAVEQCFECHRTTSWNDIPGVGHYKHH